MGGTKSEGREWMGTKGEEIEWGGRGVKGEGGWYEECRGGGREGHIDPIRGTKDDNLVKHSQDSQG